MRNMLTALALFILLTHLPQSAMGEGIPENQITTIANDYLTRNVPSEYRNEYVLVRNDSEAGRRVIGWHRKINNIPVYGESVGLWINPGTGEIINRWYNNPPKIPASEIDAYPTLSKEQAEWVAKQAYGRVDTSNTRLRIMGDRAVWSLYVYGLFIDMDADTGETVHVYHTFGGGGSSEVPTKWDPVAYYTDVFGSYMFLGALILIGGLAFVFRYKFLPTKK